MGGRELDTSKEYITMCQKATEIQEDRVWEQYDLYHSLSISKNVDLINSKIDLIKDKDKWTIGIYLEPAAFVCEFCNEENETKTFDKFFPSNEQVWLPRQDQLQDMVLDKKPYSYSQDNLSKLCRNIWSFSIDSHKYNGNSMEQLWLAFVMQEKYNKVWKNNDLEWGMERIIG